MVEVSAFIYLQQGLVLVDSGPFPDLQRGLIMIIFDAFMHLEGGLVMVDMSTLVDFQCGLVMILFDTFTHLQYSSFTGQNSFDKFCGHFSLLLSVAARQLPEF